ncbi:low molecular weight protein-tyrosine-phosphatase [Aquimarina agarivorans]|uniref:low molecular weight protein-tyrosine-phosphatase n=1 Tax=Aquimarina agarivorans TaxID=980584 RepID=UPI000248E5C8|nr:low molecular weight protein-tyrosine-phosphatase [Aquimarina agarivorans]
MSDKRINILMVCLGNICRSPLAQGILQQKLNPKKYNVQSAGTGGFHIGKLPDIRSINVARKNGIDITNQRAAQFSVADFDTYDYIFAMDTENYNNIIALATNQVQKDKVAMILNEINPIGNAEVPDPYYGGSKGFDNVYTLLDTACSILAKRI